MSHHHHHKSESSGRECVPKFRRSPYGKVPLFAGFWEIKSETLLYENPEQRVDLKNPLKLTFGPIEIKQYGLFFTYGIKDDPRPPKLGVFEPVFLDGKMRGWKAHMVDTKTDNENYLFNFTRLNKSGKVKSFNLTYTESGFGSGEDPEQTPRVENGIGKRIHDTCL